MKKRAATLRRSVFHLPFLFSLPAISAVVIFLSIGCLGLQQKEFQKPVISVNAHRLDYIDFTGVQVTLYLSVDNPNKQSVNVQKMDHRIFINGRHIMDTSQEGPFRVKGAQETTLEYRLKVPFEALPKGIGAIYQKKSIRLDVKSAIAIATPKGEVTHEVDWGKVFELPPIPGFKIDRVRIAKLGLGEATLLFDGRLSINTEGQSVKGVRWSAKLAGETLVKGSTTSVEADSKAEGQNGAHFEMEVSLSLDQLFAVNRQGIEKGAVSYSIELEIDMETPFGAVMLPLKTSGEFKWEVEL